MDSVVMQRLKYLLMLVLLVLFYFAAGKLGLMLAFVNPSATPVWPPSGIALAAFLVFGYRVWPAILVGAFLVNITTSGLLAASLMIAVGNMLEGLAGAYLINSFAQSRRVFDRVQDILKFVVLAALVSTTVSATIGVTSLVLNGLADWHEYLRIWLTWWLGDATGVLIVGPLLILWSDRRIPWKRERMLEGLFLLATLIVFSLVVFGRIFPVDLRIYPTEFAAIPIVVWAAFRFSQREVATVTVILSAITCWGTVQKIGPFSGFSPNESLLFVQTFLSTLAITGLILAAVINEGKRIEQSLP